MLGLEIPAVKHFGDERQLRFKIGNSLTANGNKLINLRGKYRKIFKKICGLGCVTRALART